MYNQGMTRKTRQTAIRLSDTDERLLAALSNKKGVNRTAILILALREMAERENVRVESDQSSQPQQQAAA